jgi:ATP-dependent DNA helicase PIF1
MSDFAKSLDQFKYSEENTQGKDASDIKRISTSIYRPPSITSLDITELSPEQRHAYTQFIKGENLFITGPGGTGKTRLVKHLIAYAKSINMNMPVCAMTGCAAVLLECNARTLHSWSGIKLAKQTKAEVISSVLKNKSVVKTWKAAQGLILDEVSMLSKKIFEIIEEIARRTKHNPLPFGGMQVVFTGDFFQLPPVGTNGDPDTEKFCFESPVWNTLFKPHNHIELKTMFRQTDPLYIEILQQIRRGYLDADKKQILQSHVRREYNEDMNNGCIPTKLFALRSKTDYVNSMMFQKINEKEYVFHAIRKTDCTNHIDTTKPFTFEESRNCSCLSETAIEQELDYMLNNLQCNQVLRLKRGAAVMCTINLDMDNYICNGSQGIVIDIIDTCSPALPVVRFSNGIIKTIHPKFWQSDEYPTLAIGQYPLTLAWALTIHKIQGATLTMAEMDIGQSIFEYGQTYVALSRIKSLDGLYLSAFYSEKIAANPKVIAFYDNIAKNKTHSVQSVTLETEKYSEDKSINNNIKVIKI